MPLEHDSFTVINMPDFLKASLCLPTVKALFFYKYNTQKMENGVGGGLKCHASGKGEKWTENFGKSLMGKCTLWKYKCRWD
jgi:hypothetical protein